jgi:hypothetical protein
MSVAVGRELHVGIAAFARSFAPSVAASLGVLGAAGAVRYAWPAISVPATVTAAVAGVAGALLALRLSAPRTFVELMRQMGDLFPRARRAATAP